MSALCPKKSAKKVISKSEADSATSAATGILAADPKKKKESARHLNLRVTKFREAKADAAKPSAARVVLIEEGLGNLGSCMYYTRAALESAVAIYEGRKSFADHPDAIEEQARPERSVRDVFAHFENIAVEDGPDGQALLCGDLVIVEGSSYDWARDLIEHAVKYSKKFPDSEFIGLSIVASGDFEEAALDDFIKQGNVPASALPKLQFAKELGIDSIQVVSTITDAVSCDLVTEAGAGGRIQKLLESKRSPHMSKKTKAKENDAAAGAHDDKAQDVELIKSMLKKHMGDDAAEDQAMQAAMGEAAKFYQSEGMEGEEAYEAAGKAMKCAAAMQASKKEAEDAAALQKKEADDAAAAQEAANKEEAKETKKESAGGVMTKEEAIALRAKIARLEESERNRDLEKVVDKMLSESKLPRKVTEQFREALGKPKSKEEAKKLFESFLKIYKAGGAGSVSDTPHFGESNHSSEAGGEAAGFGDCTEDDDA